MSDTTLGAIIVAVFLAFCGFGLWLDHEKEMAKILAVQGCVVSAPSALTTQ